MSFNKFGLLPLEIRHVIWGLCLSSQKEDTPEVCIMWPLVLFHHEDDGQDGAVPSQPFVVDTGFPVMMHVCHESRAFVLHNMSGVRFRQSAAAGCPVPYRRFRPELDAMFWGTENVADLMNLTAEPGFAFLAELRHLAVEARWGFGGHMGFMLVLFEALPKLQTLSLVLPDSSDDNVTSVPFQAPARRCRLRTISDETAKRMTVKLDLLFFEEDLHKQMAAIPDRRVSLPFFSSVFRRELDRNGRETKCHLDSTGTPYNCPGWNDEKLCFDALELPVVTFVEHRGPGEWAEVCGQRRYPTGNGGPNSWQMARKHYIPTSLRRNPEEYRGNDDDGHYIFEGQD